MDNLLKSDQSGFTLIELVVVIIILGILAATALPKFVDMSADAEKAAGNSVRGNIQAMCGSVFQQNRLAGVTAGSSAMVTDVVRLAAEMQAFPASWTDTTVAGGTTLTHVGKDNATYSIVINAESTTKPCTITSAAF